MRSNCQRSVKRSGFTLRQLFFVVFLISLPLALLFPAIQQAREAARRITCQNNLKQLCIAMHNYHDTYLCLPTAMGGTGPGGNENRLNATIPLTPFLESSPYYSRVESGWHGAPPGGPAPWDKSFPLWQTKFESLQCPSATSDVQDYQPINYAFCIGDVTTDIHQLESARGLFAPRLYTKLKDCEDGISNTIATGEIGTPDGRFQIGQIAANVSADVLSQPDLCWKTIGQQQRHYRPDVRLHRYGRGYNWVDGAAGPGLFQTILPPNSPNCAVGGSEAVDGVYSAGSYHPGGVLVGMADAAVVFLSEDIDTGNTSQPPPTQSEYTQGAVPSPYGVWGALGTRSAADDHTP